MSKADDKTNNEDISTPKKLSLAKEEEQDQQQHEKKAEHTLEEIDKELDELRPPPPSPETKHRIEEEEKRKDHKIHEEHQHNNSSSTTDTKSENKPTEHKENELVPGEPDPTVNENTKVPVLNDEGGVELKPPQGSMFHKTKDEKKT